MRYRSGTGRKSDGPTSAAVPPVPVDALGVPAALPAPCSAPCLSPGEAERGTERFGLVRLGRRRGRGTRQQRADQTDHHSDDTLGRRHSHSIYPGRPKRPRPRLRNISRVTIIRKPEPAAPARRSRPGANPERPRPVRCRGGHDAKPSAPRSTAPEPTPARPPDLGPARAPPTVLRRHRHRFRRLDGRPDGGRRGDDPRAGGVAGAAPDAGGRRRRPRRERARRVHPQGAGGPPGRRPVRHRDRARRRPARQDGRVLREQGRGVHHPHGPGSSSRTTSPRASSTRPPGRCTACSSAPPSGATCSRPARSTTSTPSAPRASSATPGHPALQDRLGHRCQRQGRAPARRRGSASPATSATSPPGRTCTRRRGTRWRPTRTRGSTPAPRTPTWTSPSPSPAPSGTCPRPASAPTTSCWAACGCRSSPPPPPRASRTCPSTSWSASRAGMLRVPHPRLARRPLPQGHDRRVQPGRGVRPPELPRLPDHRRRPRRPRRDVRDRTQQRHDPRTTTPDPNDLTAADVEQVIEQAVDQADVTRAGIRRPIGLHAVVQVAVVDRDGDLLGVFRMSDATNFSYDVAVQKARTAAFFSDDAHAFSTRAIGFLSQRYIPAASAAARRDRCTTCRTRSPSPASATTSTPPRPAAPSPTTRSRRSAPSPPPSPTRPPPPSSSTGPRPDRRSDHHVRARTREHEYQVTAISAAGATLKLDRHRHPHRHRPEPLTVGEVVRPKNPLKDGITIFPGGRAALQERRDGRGGRASAGDGVDQGRHDRLLRQPQLPPHRRHPAAMRCRRPCCPTTSPARLQTIENTYSLASAFGLNEDFVDQARKRGPDRAGAAERPPALHQGAAELARLRGEVRAAGRESPRCRARRSLARLRGLRGGQRQPRRRKRPLSPRRGPGSDRTARGSLRRHLGLADQRQVPAPACGRGSCDR